ncbi:unnamed protein product [Brugia timori]|uniref:DUF1405 domain-containing protein n=1 Tax=Brugia timori TaxID=42155 RepID=A0A0R3QTH5_9BILA|nr:unnamed protein product [Brugia timori]
MNLLTCSTFIFVSFIGFLKQSHYFKQLSRSRVPLLRGYARIVFMFFVVNVSNNLALRYNVSIPLFIIFRSVLPKLFSRVGVVLFTLADQFSKYHIIEKDGKSVHSLSNLHFNPGRFLLMFATLLSAYLGICQENLYCTYGNHSREAIFFIVYSNFSGNKISTQKILQHFLSLPGFFLFNDIWQALVHFNNSDVFFIFGLRFPLLLLWIYMMDMYYECAYTYFADYIAECCNGYNAKEILIDVILFKNPFTFMHCIGCLLVLLGTIASTLCDFKFKFARKKSV